MKYFYSYDSDTVYYGNTDNVTFLYDISCYNGIYKKSKKGLLKACKECLSLDTKYIHATDRYLFDIDNQFDIGYKEFRGV